MRERATRPAQETEAASESTARGVDPGPVSLADVGASAGNGAVARLLAGGTGLPSGVRAEAEDRFGTSFADVRVHTGNAAGEVASAFSARALTVGNHVYFGRGQYGPGNVAGREMLAHELTHVVQNRAASGPASGVSESDGAAEREAARLSTEYSAGGPLAVRGVGQAAVHRIPEPGAVKVIAPTTPKHPLIRHSATNVTFTDEPEYVREQLESYVDKNGLDSIARFENDSLYIQVNDPMLPQGGEQQGGADQDYVRKVIKTVHDELVTLKAHLSAFRDDFERRANDTLRNVLLESEQRVKAQLEHYGVKTEKKLFGLWTSHSGADNDASKALAKEAQGLRAKLKVVQAAREEYEKVAAVSGNWVYNPGAVDAATEKFLPVQKEYDTARHTAETNHPVLMAYDLDARKPETAERLDKLSSEKSDDRADTIGEELTTRLKNIEKVRAKANDDKQYVWKLERIVGTTRQLPDIKGHKQLTHPGLQASVVIERAAKAEVTEEMIAIGGAVVLLGLALVAAAPTGGLSVAGAATVAAAGTAETALQLALAYKAYQTYSLDKALAGTDYDKAKCLSEEEPSLFWLALDIVGTLAGLPGGAKNASRLFRTVVRLREEALTAKAMKLAAEAKSVAGGEAKQYESLLDQLEAAGNEAKPGAGRKLRDEVVKDGGSGTRRSSAADLDADPPTVRNPDAEPPTQRNPNVGLAKEGRGVSRTEAVNEYFNNIQANPDREYAVIQHQVTKEFRTIIGTMDGVDIPQPEFGDGWQFVRHYHPNLEHDAVTGVLGPIAHDSKKGVFGARIPSAGGTSGPGDLLASGMASIEKSAGLPEQLPVSETLDWWDPAAKRMRTSRFGYNPQHEAPYWIEMPNEADKIIRGQFKTIREAKIWIWKQDLCKPVAETAVKP